MNAWLWGYLVGAVVVVVVVALLLLMIAGARRTAEKAEAIVTALNQARDGTAGLWGLGDTVKTADRIVAAATDARASLSQGGRS